MSNEEAGYEISDSIENLTDKMLRLPLFLPTAYYGISQGHVGG